MFVGRASIRAAALELKPGRPSLHPQRFVDLPQADGIEKLPVTWDRALRCRACRCGIAILSIGCWWPRRRARPLPTYDPASAAGPDRLVVV